MFGGMGGNMAGMMKKVQKVQAQMQKMQESLLVSAQKDRSGKLASILRQHPLCR